MEGSVKCKKAIATALGIAGFFNNPPRALTGSSEEIGYLGSTWNKACCWGSVIVPSRLEERCASRFWSGRSSSCGFGRYLPMPSSPARAVRASRSSGHRSAGHSHWGGSGAGTKACVIPEAPETGTNCPVFSVVKCLGSKF